MVNLIPWKRILASWVEPRRLAEVLAEVLAAIVQAGSARWSEIARHMPGSEAAAYKRLQRLVARFDPRAVLRRWCLQEAPIVIVDITEVERPHARRTEYVGVLPPKDAGRKRRRKKAPNTQASQEASAQRPSPRRRGFWLVLLGLPFRGRVLPCGWWTYSSKTLEEEASSQNLEVQRFLEDLRALLQGRPLVADRGFHNRRFFAWLQAHGIPFIVRVRMKPPLTLADAQGESLRPVLLPGQTQIWPSVRHHELEGLTLIGHWEEGRSEPLWLLTTWPDPQEALRWYRWRMRIEAGFRDLKSHLGIEANMNQRRDWMDRTMGLVLLAYGIALLAGELLRDLRWGRQGLPSSWATWRPPQHPHRKWLAYSGLFVLRKLKFPLPGSSRRRWRHLLIQWPTFLAQPAVQTPVQS